jgi:hypothetical protein
MRLLAIAVLAAACGPARPASYAEQEACLVTATAARTARAKLLCEGHTWAECPERDAIDSLFDKEAARCR